MEVKREPWHINERFTLAHWFSTVALVISLAGFIHKMDNRLAVTEARWIIIEKQVSDNRATFSQNIKVLTQQINSRLNRIDDKLDKMLITKRP